MTSAPALAALPRRARGSRRSRRPPPPTRSRPLLVSRRKRMPPVVEQILGRDQPEHRVVGVDERQLLDLVARSSPARHRRARSGRRGRRAGARRHALRHAKPVAPTKRTSRSVRRPFQPALLDRRPRASRRRCPPCGGSPRTTVQSSEIGMGVRDDAVLGPLDRRDLGHLRGDIAGPEPAVDDADAAFLREHDRHRGPRHGVHVGRDQGALQRHVLREGRRQIDRRGIAARNDAAVRRQQEIIERAAAHELKQISWLVSYRAAAQTSRSPRRSGRRNSSRRLQ